MRLGRNGTQNVRSDLSANREVIRGKSQRKVNFGIYRLLTPESTLDFVDTMSAVLEQTMPGITEERKRKGLRTASFALNSVMASTFVPRNIVGKNRLQLIADGFNLAGDLRAIREDILPYDVDLAALLDTDRVHWDDHVNGSGRKLVVELDKTTDAYGQLCEEAQIIQSHLPAAIRVKTPDHVTLGHYGAANDSCTLPKTAKRQLATAVANELDTTGPFFAHYGPVRVGKSYSEALVEWDKLDGELAGIISLEGIRAAHNELRLVA